MKKFQNHILYSPSPHILKNTQHFFGFSPKSIFSFSFLKDSVFNRKKILILSWGNKTNQTLVQLLSKTYQVLFLEDGLYRSYNTGKQGDRSNSLIIDFKNVFYNSQSTNDFHELIKNKDEILNPYILEKGNECINFIIHNKLTKYNNNIELDDSIQYNANNVLIIDQTLGDQSIIKGNVPKHVDIEYIIKKILSLDKNANIFLKIHPETLNGDKLSALKINEKMDFIKLNNVQILEENFNPISVMEKMEKIHVLTSQVGFEALLLHKEVFVYGKPFYSMVGLTKNVEHNETIKKLSINELFSLMCLIYTNYVDLNGENIDFLTFLKNLVKQKERLSTK